MILIFVLYVQRIPTRMFRNKKLLVKCVLLVDLQVLVQYLVRCAPLDNMYTLAVVRYAQKTNFNQIWKKRRVLFVHMVVNHQPVLPFAVFVLLGKNK